LQNNLDQKRKNRAVLNGKIYGNAVPIFSRKLDAFDLAGRKNHTPQKEGCDWRTTGIYPKKFIISGTHHARRPKHH
jgi:hypothetical protein